MSDRHIVLEIPVASVADALAAEAGGADRLELNAAMKLGGLTPSPGLLAEVKARVKLPVMVMIRPRPGAFHYDDAEFAVMLRDTEWALRERADGLVFGILNRDATVDRERCLRMLDAIGGRAPAVFHRAFDLTADPFAALEELIALGFKRIMTSGQEETAYNGAYRISSLIDEADDRIEVLPAGGVNRFNVCDVVERTGCEQVHCGLRSWRADPSAACRPAITFGTRAGDFDATDAEAVKEVRRLLGPGSC